MIMKVEAFVREEKLEDVKEALNKVEVNGITISQVMGCGAQKGFTEVVRGTKVDVMLRPKIKFEIVVSSEEWAEKTIKAIQDAAFTGEVGDGKIFSYEVKNVIDKCPELKEDGSNKRECKPTLLFHNIQTVINQNQSQRHNEKYEMGTFYKFPFHLYKLESWDVEHINSNTTNPEEDVESQREWLLNIYLSVKEELQEKIKEYFNSSSEDNKTLFEEIKKEVPFGNIEWTQEEKNRIWNYALLDSSTNRSYGNSIFSGKRRIIIGKDKGKLIAIPKLSKDGKLVMTDEQNSTSSFVPPCTRQVFLKYYSATAGNNNYWTIEDAQSYLSDIESCIKKLEE